MLRGQSPRPFEWSGTLVKERQAERLSPIPMSGGGRGVGRYPALG